MDSNDLRRWLAKIGVVAASTGVVGTTAYGLLVGCAHAPTTAAPVVAAPVQFDLVTTGAGQGLTRVTSESVEEVWPAPSPDGSTLLFQEVSTSNNQEHQAIVGVEPSSGARRTIYSSTGSWGQTPAWLPNGTNFVYASNAAGGWSIVRSLTSSANAAIAVVVNGQLAPNAWRPSPSPDGRKLAFRTRLRDVDQVAIANLDGSELTILGEGTQPAWSPRGDRIAFVRRINGVQQIFTVNALTGTDLVQLTTGEYSNSVPAWSPDGSLLVFSSNRGWENKTGGRADWTRNLYLMRPDGTGVVQLTDGLGSTDCPAWGRDGWIYFQSNATGNFDIWRLHAAPEVTAAATGATAPTIVTSAPAHLVR